MVGPEAVVRKLPSCELHRLVCFVMSCVCSVLCAVLCCMVVLIAQEAHTAEKTINIREMDGS